MVLIPSVRGLGEARPKSTVPTMYGPPDRYLHRPPNTANSADCTLTGRFPIRTKARLLCL